MTQKINIPQAKTEISVRGGKGQKHDECICNFNVDITTGGCPTALEQNGSYNSELACKYCYARYVHKKQVKNKTVTEKPWKKIQETMDTKVIRIGKMTEPGGIESRELLYEVLQYNNKYKIKSILVTKLLNWDKKVSDLLKTHNSTVHFSIGYDAMETGASLRGFSNQDRVKIAKKYHKAGNNTYLRIIADVTNSMSPLIKSWRNLSIPFLITPLRFYRKDIVPDIIPNETWDGLKNSSKYEYKNGALSPKVLHNDWIDQSERCGYIGDTFYCNKCGLET
jgi:hypothetical protein